MNEMIKLRNSSGQNTGFTEKGPSTKEEEMIHRRFGWGALLLALSLAIPVFATAEDKKADAEKDDAPADAEATTDAEAPSEKESTTEVSADILGSSPVAAEEEAPPAEEPAAEPEEKKAEEAPKSSPVTGTWTKKIEFASEDGNFKFQPTGFVQPKLQLLIVGDNDDELAGSGFVLQRARLGFKAQLFKMARIALDAEYRAGAVSLLDYYADIDPWDGVFAVRVGRFRPWFGRQFMAATTQLQMIENAQAWTDKDLGLGLDRDLGVGVFGMVADVFEYGVGVWNGDGGSVFDPNASEKNREISGKVDENGDPVVAPANIDVMLGGRLAVHPLAPAGVGRALPTGNESDSEISDKPGLAIGVSAYYNKRHDRTIPVTAGGVTYDQLYYDNQLKLGADVGFQMIGLSVAGEFYLLKVWLPDDARDAVTTAIGAANSQGVKTVDGYGMGAYLQVGYFVLPRKLEIAARFDMADPSAIKDGIRGSRLYPGIGATYHIFGNNLKAQFMYRLDIAAGFEDTDPGYRPTGHDLFLMLQASI